MISYQLNIPLGMESWHEPCKQVLLDMADNCNMGSRDILHMDTLGMDNDVQLDSLL